MKKVVLLTESPFSRRDHDRFGVEVLRRTFAVSILDCTGWLKPDFAAKYSDLAYHCPGYIAVADERSVHAALNALSGALAIDYLSDAPECVRVRRALAAHRIRRAVIQGGLLPNPAEATPTRFARILREGGPRLLLQLAWRRVRGPARSGPGPDITVMSGTAGLNGANPPAQMVWAHSFDFDVFLAAGAGKESDVAPYAVFLDEDMCFHSDYDHSNITAPATPDAYFPAMREFFDRFERETGLPVVIAAHPRARYDLRPSVWGGRKTVQGKTAELVRDSTLVLCHQSTAVSFAVLWRKPLVFLTSDELSKSYLGPRISIGSKLLRAPQLNVEAGPPVPARAALLTIDAAAYEEYEDAYIKRRGTPREPLWEIVSDYLQHAFG